MTLAVHELRPDGVLTSPVAGHAAPTPDRDGRLPTGGKEER